MGVPASNAARPPLALCCGAPNHSCKAEKKSRKGGKKSWSKLTSVVPAPLLPLQVATLRSAVKLEQEQQFLIAKKLQELTGSKNIKLKPVIDESLIAGFVVSYGSSQIDLSVKGQLDKISAELVGWEGVRGGGRSGQALLHC